MTAHGRFVSLVVGVILFWGCKVPPPQPPVKGQLPFLALKVNGESEVASEGLRVTLTPIVEYNASSYPQIWKTIAWNETKANEAGVAQTTKHAVAVNVVPMPTFQVRIANNTGHVVRLTTAVFRLESNVGKKWQTFSSTEELLAWSTNFWVAGMDPAVTVQITPQLQSAIGGLQLLGRSVELLKGDEWSGYLVFNLGFAKPQDVTDFMNNTERLTVRLAEVPIETNDAGQATKTTEFTFAVDKAMSPVPVVCPPGTTTPSWEGGCKREL